MSLRMTGAGSDAMMAGSMKAHVPQAATWPMPKLWNTCEHVNLGLSRRSPFKRRPNDCGNSGREPCVWQVSSERSRGQSKGAGIGALAAVFDMQKPQPE